MNAKRHEVRTIHPKRPRYFDDQIWPAHAALAALTMASLAMVFWLQRATGPLAPDRARWAGLVIVASSMGVAVCLPWVTRRWLRRGSALSLFISLLLNVVILFALANIHLVPPVREAVVEDPLAKPAPEQNTVAEFYPMAAEGDDRPQQEIQKPVSTGEPTLEQRDFVRKTTITVDEPLEQQVESTPDVATQPRIMPVERQEYVDSAPRRFELEGTLSRQVMEAKPVIGPPTAEIARVPARSLAAPQPRPAAVEPNRGDAPAAQLAQQQPAALATMPDPTVAAPPTPTPTTRASQPQEQPQVSDTAERSPPSTPADAPAELPMPARRTIPLDTIADQTQDVPGELATSAAGAQLSQRRNSPDAPSAREVEMSGLVRPEPAGVPRSLVAVKPPEDIAVPLDLPERQAMTAEMTAPSLVEVETSEPASPVEERTQIAPTLAARPRPAAPLESPLVLPSPEALAIKPQPYIPDAGAVQRVSETPGVSDVASDPAANAAAQQTGTEDTPMTSPARLATARNRIEQVGPAARPRSSSREVAVDQTSSLQPSEQTSPTPAQTARGEERAKRGQVELPDVPTQDGPAAVEIGSRLAVSDSGMTRASAGGQPAVIQPAAQNPAVPRTTGGGALPSLPSTQIAAELASSGSPDDAPSATAASPDVGLRRALATATAPDEADRPLWSGAPAATERAQPAQLARTALVPQQPDEIVQASGVPPVDRTAGAARPIADSTDLPLVEVPSAAATASSDSQPPASQPVADAVRTARERPGDGLDSAAAESIAAIADAADGANSPAATAATLASRPPVSRRVDPAAPARLPTAIAQEPISGGAASSRPQELVARPLRKPVPVPIPATAASSEETPMERVDVEPRDLAVPSRRLDVVEAASGGLVVAVNAADGLGGLSSDVAPDVGLLSRQAQPESDQVADTTGRFLRRPVGGPLSVDTSVPVPTRAYQTRLNRRGDEPAGGNGRPSPRTEEAIELGLVYLASQQLPGGGWSLARAGDAQLEETSGLQVVQSDTAATGLALLSFLGAGYHHRSDQYGNVVRDGLRHLIERQKPDGDLYQAMDADSNRSAWLYSHAIAAIALCEAYGMTQDPDLRDPAQRSVDFIVAAQHPQRGGWRYSPGVGSDTSVSGWMVMALRSGELANLSVPISVWENVERWLDRAQASTTRPELYRYNPLAPNTLEQGHGRRPTKTMTAVGLLMRMYTGWRRDDEAMIAGAQYLRANSPEIGTIGDPQRDTYYWYYATQVMFHMRGEYWTAWNEQLHPLLTSTQVQVGTLAGSWDPMQPIPDRWGPHGGRLYVTTLNLLSLEVYYRHLPIYEDTAR